MIITPLDGRLIRCCVPGLLLLMLVRCDSVTAPTVAPSAVPFLQTSTPVAAAQVASATPDLPAPPTVRGVPTSTAAQSSAVLDQRWQTDWLRGIPCTAPCYAGITPGHTTIAEARVILERNPRVGALVDRYGVVEWGWNNLDLIGGGGTQGEPTERGGVLFGPPGYTEQSPVMVIGPNLEPVPFAEVVRVFGTPSDVLATFTEAPTEDVGTPDFQPGTIVAYTLGVVYRQQGIFFYADVPFREKPVLTSTLMLLSPTFFDPTAQFTQHLQLEPMVPWQGWQPFDVYCRDLYTFEPCSR